MTMADLRNLSRRVFQIASELEPPRAPPRETASDGPPSDQARRQLQARAYAAVLVELGVLDDERNVYVDLGAGSGLVSAEIRAALPRAGGGQFILVDQRDKPPPDDAMCRLCADIATLGSAAELRRAAHAAWPSGAPVVVVANHLCGGALDRSIELFAGERALAAFCAATCCHDKAGWATYCNREFVLALGLGEAEFGQLCAWSALAPRRNKPPDERARVRDAARALRAASLDECERLGGACRLIIDTGRRLRLEAGGLATHLRCHVPFEVTADNVLIVASRPSAVR